MDRRDLIRRLAAIGLVAAAGDLRQARASVTTTGAGKKPAGGGGGGGNTWDPVSLDPSWALTGSNLIATHSGTSNTTVRGNTFRAAGTPFYLLTLGGGGRSLGIGFCTSGQSTSDGLGSNATSIAMTPNDGAVFINGITVGNVGVTATVGDVLKVQYNASAVTMQMGVNGGALGTAVDISSLGVASIAPAVGCDESGDIETIDTTNW